MRQMRKGRTLGEGAQGEPRPGVRLLHLEGRRHLHIRRVLSKDSFSPQIARTACFKLLESRPKIAGRERDYNNPCRLIGAAALHSRQSWQTRAETTLLGQGRSC